MCQPCSIDTYKNTTEHNTGCIPCPISFVTASVGSISAYDCTCIPGSYNSGKGIKPQKIFAPLQVEEYVNYYPAMAKFNNTNNDDMHESRSIQRLTPSATETRTKTPEQATYGDSIISVIPGEAMKSGIDNDDNGEISSRHRTGETSNRRIQVIKHLVAPAVAYDGERRENIYGAHCVNERSRNYINSHNGEIYDDDYCYTSKYYDMHQNIDLIDSQQALLELRQLDLQNSTERSRMQQVVNIGLCVVCPRICTAPVCGTIHP